jgi:thiamine-monophosphate kinase
VRRNGAQKGNLLCVSGDLGAAYLGLTLLEREKKIFLENPGVQPDLEGEKYVVGRILKPEARKDIIEYFDQNQVQPTAMIDVSDGLGSEILHICKQSKVGCVLYEEKIPISEETRMAAFKFNLDPTACALSGGEDYELLFTIKQDDYETVSKNTDISIIGYITDEEAGAHIVTKGGNKHPITAQGWNAFK